MIFDTSLATAILVGTVMVMQRHRQNEMVPMALDQDSQEECAESCCSDSRG